MIRKITWEKVLFLISALCLIVLSILDLAKFSFVADEAFSKMLTGILVRLFGAICAFALLIYIGYQKLLKTRPTLYSLILVLPCLLVAINNFPFIESFTGKLTMQKSYLLLPFIAECLAVGFFEEFLFRGLLFMFLLEKRMDSKKGILFAILASSVLFGAVHLLNLFAGASVGSVVMQMGYSFLIGAMMCFALLCTKNIFVCVFLHALFNFCGLFYPTLGGGQYWGMGTVILTVVVAVAVTVYAVVVFMRPKFATKQSLQPLFARALKIESSTQEEP